MAAAQLSFHRDPVRFGGSDSRASAVTGFTVSSGSMWYFFLLIALGPATRHPPPKPALPKVP
jgi:hypothetical protein